MKKDIYRETEIEKEREEESNSKLVHLVFYMNKTLFKKTFKAAKPVSLSRAHE